MIGSILRSFIFPASRRREEVPSDKLQLDAAQDRLAERSNTLSKEVDELTKMMNRMKKTQRKGKQR